MGQPDSIRFSNQTESGNGVSDQSRLKDDANKCPLDSTPMYDPQFNQVYCLTKAGQDTCFLPPDNLLLKQLGESKPADFNDFKMPVCEQPKTPVVPKLEVCEGDNKFENRGPLDLTINGKGEITGIRDKHGNYFSRQADGSYVQHFQSGGEVIVKNMKIDGRGNMSFDAYPGTAPSHCEYKADGSYSIDSADLGGKLVFDTANHLVEAPAGDGHVRKFHYTDGQLDQIDGRLGHWDREVRNGQVRWVNTNGTVWEGDFVVNPSTNDLEFRGRNGAAWNFTTFGKDVQATPERK